MIIALKIKNEAKYILDVLLNRGYEAYVVGGCVRDSLLNILKPEEIRDVNDWDICTNALPHDIISIFKNEGHSVIETGIKHGTVTVVVNSGRYEVTTFRIDGEYGDGRRPDNVEFTSSIEEDLMRRDLTINAMAYNHKTGLIGAFTIKEHLRDIQNKTIRFVGNADERIAEDALRILRALRFASKLGFKISDDSKRAILDNKELLSNISAERIQSELLQILNGKYAYTILDEYSDIITYIIPELKDCINFQQRNPHHIYDVYIHTLKAIEHIKDLDAANIKMALLLHDIGKPSTFALETSEDGEVGRFLGHPKISRNIAVNILKRLKFSNKDTENILKLVEYHDNEYPSRPSIRRAIQKMGKDTFEDLLILRECDIAGQSKVYRQEKMDKLKVTYDKYNQVLAQSMQLTTKQLDISGKDLMELGFKPGKIFSVILNELLDKVINEELNNKHDDLIQYIKDNLIKQHDV